MSLLTITEQCRCGASLRMENIYTLAQNVYDILASWRRNHNCSREPTVVFDEPDWEGLSKEALGILQLPINLDTAREFVERCENVGIITPADSGSEGSQ